MDNQKETLELKRDLLATQIQLIIYKFLSGNPEVRKLQVEHARYEQELAELQQSESGTSGIHSVK